MINKMNNTQMKLTNMKKNQPSINLFQTLFSFFLIILLTFGQQKSLATELQKNTDSCCIVKNRLTEKNDLNISIKLPTPNNWAFADYEIAHSLYVDLNPTLKSTSNEQLNKSDLQIQKMFDENFKISNPKFDEADNTIASNFFASNVMFVNNYQADITINNLFWLENVKPQLNCNLSNNSLQPISIKINQPLKLDWEKSDEAINFQILSTNTIQTNG